MIFSAIYLAHKRNLTHQYPQSSTLIQAGLDIDGKYALEALCPTHRCGGLVAIDPAPGTARVVSNPGDNLFTI